MKISVGDYDQWKSGFEKNQELRKSYGSRGALAFSNPENRNEVTVIIKGMNKQSMQRARESGDFQRAMKDNGIVGEPSVRFLNYNTELDQ
ncbi:MAG: hypothetical protein ACXAB7_08630 [Candidatus Kariarchaeaceae archaeon]